MSIFNAKYKKSISGLESHVPICHKSCARDKVTPHCASCSMTYLHIYTYYMYTHITGIHKQGDHILSRFTHTKTSAGSRSIPSCVWSGPAGRAGRRGRRGRRGLRPTRLLSNGFGSLWCAKWVWVKIKPPGNACFHLITRVPFGEPIFDAQPNGHGSKSKSCPTIGFDPQPNEWFAA